MTLTAREKRKSYYINEDFKPIHDQFLDLIKTDPSIPKDVRDDLKKPSQKVSFVLRRLIKFYVTSRSKKLQEKQQ